MSFYSDPRPQVSAPHYGPKNSLKRSDARQRESKLVSQAEERHEMLCQLQDYVKYSLQPKLETVISERDELAEEVDRLEVENDQIKEQFQSLHAQLNLALRAKDDSSSVIGEKFDTVLADHKEHLAAQRQALQLELDSKSEEIRVLRDKLSKSNAAEAVDLEGRRRINELEKMLALRDEDVRELNLQLGTVREKLVATEHRAVEVAPIVSALSKTTLELKMFVEDATERATSLATAASRAGVDGVSAVTAWKSLQTTVDKIKDGVPVRTLLEDVHVLCVGLRSAARQEGVFVAQSVKNFIMKQQELSALVVRKDHEKQMERDLSKRRLDEVERDRHEERETLLKQIEKEKMKLMLQGGNGGGIPSSPTGNKGGSPGSPSRFYGGSPSAGRGLVGGINHLGGGEDDLAPGLAHSSCQTGSELLESNSHGESLLVMRLRQEVASTTAQLADVRQTISVMEEQRRHFMGFVGDRVQSDTIVKSAINGSSLDFSFGGAFQV